MYKEACMRHFRLPSFFKNGRRCFAYSRLRYLPLLYRFFILFLKLIFTASVIGHSHHLGRKLGDHVYQFLLCGHDLVDVFIGHRGFV